MTLRMTPRMMLAVDVAYREADDGTHARAAGLVFGAWSDERALDEIVVTLDDIAPYEPGAFFRRELPCIRAVLDAARAKGHDIVLLVVDAYVDLAPPDAPHPRRGLGRVVHDELHVDVVGVAKTRFTGSGAVEILRGESKSPLFITAASAAFDAKEAARNVKAMHGAHRLPTLLSRVDALARGR
jgi:deoxyribonuclease V